MSSTVLCSHSSAADLNISKEAVIRSTVNFHRSIWGDRFLTYNEREDQAWEEQQAKELKEEEYSRSTWTAREISWSL
ncbi:hypothetical protein L2E82_49526 [Cichorium intybus]|uniref:Uncharacterized protein n=1 Tax=Cichorium intybus TaxID=13427 RepID=A0ACB8Z0E5_CICIN|nr:hypothetical protein L2E82_49526 [Cichorium intybus]